MSLSVKYRPNDFNSVVGQDITVSILKQQIATGNIKNCYIFCGSTGCGKTSMARIFAKELNGVENSAIEVDAASNNGVDNVREIVKTANERSLLSEYKIIVMDEAHMLTTAAWNALLKTIEEPPKYTIFIFCTTNPNKIPETIQNRCQRFNFTRIPSTLIKERLMFICNQEGFVNADESCEYISKNCKNQMRDAVAMLERVADFSSTFSLNTTESVLGLCKVNDFIDLTNYMLDGKQDKVIELLNSIYMKGVQVDTFIDSYFSFILDVNKYIIFKSMLNLNVPEAFERDIVNLISFDNPSKIYSYYMYKIMELRSSAISFNDIVAGFIRMTRLE